MDEIGKMGKGTKFQKLDRILKMDKIEKHEENYLIGSTCFDCILWVSNDCCCNWI